MTFWICASKPEKFCVTRGGMVMMITHKNDELKVVQRRLDAGYAANIKSRYRPDDIENYPILKHIISLLTA